MLKRSLSVSNIDWFGAYFLYVGIWFPQTFCIVSFMRRWSCCWGLAHFLGKGGEWRSCCINKKITYKIITLSGSLLGGRWEENRAGFLWRSSMLVFLSGCSCVFKGNLDFHPTQQCQWTRSEDVIRTTWRGGTTEAYWPPLAEIEKRKENVHEYSFCLPELIWEERTAPKLKSSSCARRVPHRLVKIWDTVSLTAKKKKKEKKTQTIN